MNKVWILVPAIAAMILPVTRLMAEPSGSSDKAPQKLPFYVFSDQVDHFIPSGFMGDTSDITMLVGCSESPAKGKTCVRISYNGKSPAQQKWVGVYWQDPQNNWGTVKGAGFNLVGAKKLKFQARGSKGGETIEFKCGGISGEYPDSFRAEGPIVALSSRWQEYEIDLSGQDLRSVIGGFVFTLSREKNPEGAVFYLDEIRYE